MIPEKENTRLSKLLSYILRHKPGVIEIDLDQNGWANVDELINKLNQKNVHINFELLKYVTDTNNKKRFAFNYDFSKIRASQGHSIKVDLEYIEKEPPEILYHGTVEKFIPEIFKEGLKKMGRHHVHLSADKATAMQVGERRGKPVILIIKSGGMFKNGYKFFLSDNGVWLTEHVPSTYIVVL
jgi:putative RNA 2'-phosphotransferase